MLQDIQEYLRNESLDYVLANLPPCEDHEIEQDESGEPVLHLGREKGSTKTPIRLWSGRSNYYELAGHLFSGKSNEFVEKYATGDKSPFDWHVDLYQGLFREVMSRPSRALLDYYFLQWAAHSPEASNYSLPESCMFRDIKKRKDLCHAIDILSGTEQFFIHGRKVQEIRATNQTSGLSGQSSPSISPSSSKIAESRPSMEAVTNTGTQQVGLNNVTGTTEKDETPIISSEIRKLKAHNKVPNLDNLPFLTQLDLEMYRSRDDNEPALRLCIGRSDLGKIWTSIEKNSTSPRCEQETEHQPGLMRKIMLVEKDAHGIVTRKDAGNNSRTKDVRLHEPFHSSRGQGSYVDRILVLAKYYLLLVHQREGLDLQQGDFYLSQKSCQYLKSVASEYGRTAFSSSSQVVESREQKAEEVPESLQTTAILQSVSNKPSLGLISTPEQVSLDSSTLHERGQSGDVDIGRYSSNTGSSPPDSAPGPNSHSVLLTPTSPPMHERGSFRVLDDEHGTIIEELRNKQEVLFERRQELQHEIQEHSEAIDRASGALEQTNDAIYDTEQKIRELEKLETDS